MRKGILKKAGALVLAGALLAGSIFVSTPPKAVEAASTGTWVLTSTEDKVNYDDKAYSVSNDMAYESGFITFVMKGPLKETDIVGYCDRYYQVSEAPTSIQAGGEISFTMKLVVENVKRWPYVGNPYIWCGHDRLTDSSGNSSLSGNSDGSGNYDSEGAYVNSALSHSMTVSGTIGVDICEPAFMSKQRSGLRMSALLSEANMIKHENICEL